MKERKYKEDYALESYIDDKGREKRRAVYRGKWYALDTDAAGKKKLTLHCVGLAALFAVFYIIYMRLSTPSAWCMYVLPVAAAGLIPLVYWCMGLFTLWRAPEKMTTTQRESGMGRVMRSAMGCMVLLAMACVGDVVFLFQGAELTAELPGLALLMCSAMTGYAAFRHAKARYDAMKTVSAPEGGNA